MTKTTIRKATARDSRAFLTLLVALADFEHLKPPDQAAKRRIARDVFVKRRVHLFVAEEGRKCVGYALYFFNYSSFLARPTLYLEDIFILEEFRGRGLGKALFLACVDEAVKQHCGRMEWAVLTWNAKAIEFYEELGAARLSDWFVYRMTPETLLRLSKRAPGRIRSSNRRSGDSQS